MKKQTNIPSSSGVREYIRDGYAVWTTLTGGSGINKKEVVIKGTECQRTHAAMARTIGMQYSEWVTRVQVIRWSKGDYIAWVNVKNDKLYEFVNFFNESKKLSKAYAMVKRGVDSEKKLVIHKVEHQSKEDIAKIIGVDKVQHVEKKGKVAFVTMTTQTYAQAAVSNKGIEAEISAYFERKSDPVVELSKRFSRLKEQLTKQVDTLQAKVEQLERALRERTMRPKKVPKDKLGGSNYREEEKKKRKVKRHAVEITTVEDDSMLGINHIEEGNDSEASNHQSGGGEVDIAEMGGNDTIDQVEVNHLPNQVQEMIDDSSEDWESVLHQEPTECRIPSDSHVDTSEPGHDEGDALLDTPSGTLGNNGVMFKLSEKQGVTRLRRLIHNKQASMYRFLAPEHTECEEHTPIKENGKRGAHLMLSEKKNKKPMLGTPHKAPHSTSTNSEFNDLASETEPLPNNLC